MIRTENLQDYAAIAKVHIQAFGRENEAKLVDKIRNSDRYIPQLSLVAVDDIIVGHVLFSYIDLVGEETLKVLGLAPVAVIPKFQNRGIGTALINIGLATAKAMAEPLVIVLGHPQFYSRFGFQPSVNYDIQSPFAVPAEFFMVNFLQERESFKGKVVYPSTFEEV